MRTTTQNVHEAYIFWEGFVRPLPTPLGSIPCTEGKIMNATGVTTTVAVFTPAANCATIRRVVCLCLDSTTF